MGQQINKIEKRQRRKAYLSRLKERVAAAIRVKAQHGKADLRDFPLLMHIDEIITNKQPVAIPWEAFTFEK